MIKRCKKELKIFLLLFIVYMSILSVVNFYYEKQNKVILQEDKRLNEEVKKLEIELIEKDKKIETLKSEIDKLWLEIEQIKKPMLISLGEFKLTAYCECEKCCGKWSGGLTASGTEPTEYRTIAVDTNLIPFGTKIIIDGRTYIAEDTGSKIKGKCIDVYMDSHEEALEFGVQYKEVYILYEYKY